MLKRLTLILGITLITSGCAGDSNLLGKLYIPPEPTYPAIKAGELACLADNTYTKLVERDMLKNLRAEKLEAIITLRNKRK